MALSEVTTTGNLHDYFGGDFDVRRAKVWATTNASDNTIHDESTGESRIGGGTPPTVAADGTVTWTHWAPGVDANPASWQTTYHIDVPDRNAPGGRVRQSYGPFTVTTSGLLTALVEEQAVPATYLTTVTTLLDGYVTEAEAARDGAVAIVGPVDGVVEALVKNTGGVGPLTSAALSATLVPRGEGSPDSALAPLYVDNLPHSMGSAAPTNAATFGAITVTGTAGSKTLTATGAAATLAAVGAVAPWDAVLNRGSGDDDFFVTVMSTNGSTTLTLLRPLDKAFTGTLSPKYTAPLDQHITREATKAYVQHIANETGLYGSRGRIMAGCWASQPPAYGTALWVRNAALIAYGISNSAAPIVQTALATQITGNVQATIDNVSQRALSGVAGISCGTHATGHGCEATLYPGRIDGVAEFWTAAYRSTGTSAAASTLTVTAVADGETIYTGTFDSFMNRHRIPLHGASKVVISVTNLDGTPTYIYCSQLQLREAGAAARPGGATKKVVLLADSWGEYHSGAFATDIADKTGAEVVNHSLSGMTTEWALSWFDTYVLAEKPDECWIHFFTNDANNLAGTFTAPDGSTPLLWPAGLGTDTVAAKDHWRANILQLVRRCQAAGIKPVVIMPGGTASPGQAQKHFGWSWWLQRPALTEDYQALSAELADVTSYANLFGKKTGARVMVGNSPKYAAGPLAADAWKNPVEDALTALQRVTLKLSDYAVSTGVVIGTDSNADGLSDGLSALLYGGFVDTVTPSIVSSRQRLSWAYGAGSGNQRYGLTFAATSGIEYLVAADIINGGASENLDAYTDIGGGSVWTKTTLTAGGAGPVYYRGAASSTATKYARLAPTRTNSTTEALDISRMIVVNLNTLFADAPNLALLSTADLVTYVLAMKP